MIPLHRKLGYDHMLEMREIEARIRSRADGTTGIALHFEAIRHYEIAHKDDPSFRQRQKNQEVKHVYTNEHWLRLALEEIRDGHNDPRALARAVLEKIDVS